MERDISNIDEESLQKSTHEGTLDQAVALLILR